MQYNSEKVKKKTTHRIKDKNNYGKYIFNLIRLKHLKNNYD